VVSKSDGGMQDLGLGALRLLVVDDEEDIRVLLRAMLGALGIGDVREAADGAAAFDEVREHPIDIVISDVNMAPVNGIELLRRLRTDPDSPDPNVPFIVLTGHAAMDRVIEARDHGATAFLAKPMTERDLRERVLAIAKDRTGKRRLQCPPSRQEESADAEESLDYLAFREKVKNTNINEQALLATDYLNHFNELIMLLEMLPDCPEILEELKEWRPKSYKQHFLDSNLSYKELAVAAYDHVPNRFLRPFEETVARIDRRVEAGIGEIDAAMSAADPETLRRTAMAVVEDLQESLATANAIIHGSLPVMVQDDIDNLFAG